MTNKTREQAIEKIAQRLHNRYFRQDEMKPWDKLTKKQREFWLFEAGELVFLLAFEDVLKSLGYVQKDPDQSLDCYVNGSKIPKELPF